MNMRLPSFADPANLVRREEPQEPPLPQDIDALRLLQMVYRGEVKESSQQMRAAIESLPFEHPKLTAVGVGYLDGTAFASRLERALMRSERARLIEGTTIRVEDERR